MYEKFKFGIGLHPAAGMGAEYNLRHPVYGYEIYKSEASAFRLPLGAAYKLNDQLALGASVGLIYQNFHGSMPFTVKSGPSALSNVRVDGMGFFGNIGLLYELNDQLKLGATYKLKTTTNVSGDATINMYAQLLELGVYPDIISDPTGRYDAEFDFEWPQSLSIGVCYKATNKLLLAADVEWINWSDALDDIIVKYSNGTNQQINGLTGGALNYTYSPNWNDQFVFKLGGEYALTNKLRLRCGVIYGKSPVTDEALMPIISAITEWSGTVGIGYKLSGRFDINLAYEHSFNNTVDTRISNVSEEYDNSSVKLSVHYLYIGFTYRL